LDRTAEFRASVNSLRTKNGESLADQKEALLKKKEQIPFFETAKYLLKPIGSLHTFLRSQKSDYLNPHKYVSTLASKMTNAERDELEEESARQIKKLNEKIQSLKSTIVTNASKDLRAHQHAIIILLFDRLNQVQALMNEMKKERTKQVREENERLYPSKFRPELPVDELFDTSPTEDKYAIKTKDQKLNLSESDQKMFAQENKALLIQWHDKLEEIRRAEKSMMEISQQMTYFSNEVLRQEEQINEIYDTAISSTANITRGNTHLRDAMERQVNSRIVNLFFLVLAPVALWFLDMYIP